MCVCVCGVRLFVFMFVCVHIIILYVVDLLQIDTAEIYVCQSYTSVLQLHNRTSAMSMSNYEII